MLQHEWVISMNKLPSDLKILQCIYDLYRRDSMGPLPWEDSARAPIYVRVDSTHVARSLNADPGIMFGRLYYYLDYKHRYQHPMVGGCIFLRSR